MTREQDDDILFRYHDGDILTPEEHARVEDLMKRELKKNRRRPSGGQQNAHIRLARLRERQADRGLKRVEVVVPEARANEIRQIAATMRQESTMETLLNKLHIEFPDGQINDIELGDVALPGDDSQAALAALETMFPDAEIKMEGKRFWIEEEGIEATLYRDDD